MIRRFSSHHRLKSRTLVNAFDDRWKIFGLTMLAVVLFPIALKAQPIRINEIMYAPNGLEPQWIELYNLDSSVVDIAGWSFISGSGNVTVPTNLQTADQFNQFIVITTDSAALRAKRPGKYMIVQCALPQLSSERDAVVLKDASFHTIDSVTYRASWGGTTNASLERISASGPSTDSANWGASIAPAGATPGAKNSLSFPAIRDLALDSLSYQLSNDSLLLSVRIENRGNRTLDSSILIIASDSGTGSSTLYSKIFGALGTDSAITLRLSFPFLAYYPVTYSISITNPQDTIFSDDTLRFRVTGRVKALSVVINEIMFAPISPEPEWIELWNTTADTLNLSGWIIAVKAHSAVTIPDSNSILAPDSMVIVTSNADALRARRSIPPERIITLNVPALVNTGSSIALKDGAGTLVDSAVYAGASTRGISTERIDALKPGYDSSNWAASLDTSGATILRQNSVRKRAHDVAVLSAAYWDDSLLVLLRNNGIDTDLNPEIALRIDGIDTAQYSTLASIPEDSIAEFLLPLPGNFFGLFPATLFLEDSLDEQHANDTIQLSVRRPVPNDSLVINEIMFAPSTASCEWFEVYDRSSSSISLDSIKLVTGEKRAAEYSHTLKPLVIAPNSFGVVAADSSLFYSTYPLLQAKKGVANLNVSTLDLGRDSCFMVLHNPDSSTVDSVHYFKSWQHSLVRKTFTGISLERIDPSGPSTTEDNWQASVDSAGATPLAPNSVANTLPHDTILPAGTSFTAHFDPNIFSPEYDAAQNTSLLTVQTGEATNTWELRVRIYDTHGRMVRLLTDAAAIMGGTILPFDGRRDNGQFLPPGVYAALIELTSQNPIRTMSKTVGIVIAGKRR